jgi:hypothetical protein
MVQCRRGEASATTYRVITRILVRACFAPTTLRHHGVASSTHHVATPRRCAAHHVATPRRCVVHPPRCDTTALRRPPTTLRHHGVASSTHHVAAPRRCAAHPPRCDTTALRRPPTTLRHHGVAPPTHHVATPRCRTTALRRRAATSHTHPDERASDGSEVALHLVWRCFASASVLNQTGTSHRFASAATQPWPDARRYPVCYTLRRSIGRC